MPKKARDGEDTAGLLAYLYGPGKRDEHVDPHMVAAWDPYVDDPARSPDMTIFDLALLLDAPVHALLGKRPRQHVYHVAVRNAPEDRILTDAEWAEVAREMMHAAGVAPHDDDQGCRWVAIRHADDHIHIVATKARQDGRQPNLRQDIVKMHAAARIFETRFGLRSLTHGDKTARKWPKTGEAEKAARRGLAETARESLQRTVRETAAAAVSDADFFARLRAAGVRVQQRIAPDGNVTGYTVALPGDRDGSGRAVWFPGSKLAPDLSLPQVRERWQKPLPKSSIAPADAWRVAEEKVRQAAGQLGAGGLHQGAGDVAALGDLVVIAAVNSPRLVRDQMRQAATEFERASRAPVARELEGQARELYRTSSQTLSQAAASAGRNDTAAALGFLVALVTAVAASRRWHEAQEYRAQAEAAGRAGRLLREAVEVTTGATAAREFRPGRRRANVRPTAARRTAGESGASGERLMAVVQQAVPHLARGVLADAAWPALCARLVEIERAGDDPVKVLGTVAARRELGTADSVAEVLSWRLDGWRQYGSSRAAATGTSTPATSTGGTGGTGPARKTGAPAPTRRAPGDEQPKGPRRAR
ncbi:relaxase/mobilization nuclease domain-containing protein [Streptomyces sp. NPDC058475]|uniref:relaxase/mobilization nuclease domain-containing protein n=1 Tax=unclassified Streptomyces TaxID=2593676 RepID=UPI00365862F8